MKRIKKFFQKKAVAITTLVLAVIAATNIGILRSGISESFGVGGFFLGTLLITTAVGICGIVKGATMVKDKNKKSDEQKKEAPKFTQQKQQQIGNDSSRYASNFTKSSFDQQKFQQKTDRFINNASEKANRFGIKMGQIFNNQNANNGFNGNVNNNVNNNYNNNYNNNVNSGYNQNFNNNVNGNYNRNFNNNVNNNYNRNVNNNVNSNANRYNSNNQYNRNVNTQSGSYYYGNSNNNAGYYGNNRGNVNNGNSNVNNQNTSYYNASNAYMNKNSGNNNNNYSGNNTYTGNTANRNYNGDNKNSRGLDESAQTNYFKNEPGESTYRSGPLKK